MRPLRFPPDPVLRGLLLLISSLALLASPVTVRADEVSASSSARGLILHGPEETLRNFCREVDGQLWLTLPGGARFALVTSTSDPCITNPGDGSFHPLDLEVVRQALAASRFPLLGVSAHVFLLPYPRRDQLASAAGPGLILLSPGVLPLSVEQQHAVVAHELGHVIQYALMPDDAEERWSRYRELRGITDLSRFHSGAPHADRPHEIFAEDFRALFGGSLAGYSGTIENPDLAHPSDIPGLEPYVLSLAGLPQATLQAFPNPSRGGLTFRRPGGPGEPIDLFDLTGRRVSTLSPSAVAEGWAWTWDGTDERGVRCAGVLFAKLRGSQEPAVRVVLLSERPGTGL